MHRTALILALLASPLPAAGQGPVPAGPAFAVTGYTTSFTSGTQIASDAAGTFVIT